MPTYEDKKCLICGSYFSPRSKKQKLCGSEECKHQWKVLYDKSRYLEEVEEVEKQCIICGSRFITTDARRKYCDLGHCVNDKPKVRFKLSVQIR